MGTTPGLTALLLSEVTGDNTILFDLCVGLGKVVKY